MKKRSAGPWDALPTEGRHPDSGELDRLPPRDAVALLLREDGRGVAAALRHSADIARAAEWVAETLERGGDVWLAGAGTSGRLGVLEAAELPPTFGTDPERVRAVIAGGPEAVFSAAEGAEDREDDGRAAVAALRAGDLLIAISASSVTPFARGALAVARARGSRSVLLTCASPVAVTAAAPAAADLILALDTGPEALTGSTRLKAGSATKAALNAMTTVAMIRLGKVFENLMVDLRPGSAKLRDRAVRIVAAAGRVSRPEAERALTACGGEVKTAIVAARLGVEPARARQRLERAGGRVRAALER